MCLDNDYAVLDVESGSIHKIDKPVYDYLNGSTPECDASTLIDIKSEIDTLKASGLLFSDEITDEKRFNEPVVKAICLHVAHDCNLRCKYCFANTGDYHKDRGLMSKEVAEKALDLLVKNSKGRKNLEVDFFGGEPLLNFDTVEYSVDYGNRLASEYGKNIRFTITTNGYYVTDKIASFINNHMKNLVISIDGRENVHNAMRPSSSGKSTYNTVVKNAKALLKGRGTKEYYIRGTYTRENLDFAEDVVELVNKGFKSVSIEPVISDGPLGIREEDLDLIYKQYEKLANIYELSESNGNPFVFFHFMINLSSGPCLNKRLRGCGAGLEYVAVTPSGDIYPCHQFAEQDGFVMGNVFEGITNREISKLFNNNNVYEKESCKNCWAKYYCSGGCAADAYFTNGDILIPDAVSCSIERKRLETAIMLEVRKRSKKRNA